MSEEILEQTAEELEEEQQAVAEEPSGEKILDEAKAKVEKEEVDEEEVAEEAEEVEEVEEAISIPKTKAGMIKALYDQLNGMKKADLSDSWCLNCVGSGFSTTTAIRLCIIGKEMYGKGKVL